MDAERMAEMTDEAEMRQQEEHAAATSGGNDREEP